MLMMAVVLSVITSFLMILTVVFCCHRKPGDRRRYEIVSIMSPTKSQPPSSGWAGDLETDIPASLFPKHVQVKYHHDLSHLCPYLFLFTGSPCFWWCCILKRIWFILSSQHLEIQNVLQRWRTCCILCWYLGESRWIHSHGSCWNFGGFSSLETHLGH